MTLAHLSDTHLGFRQFTKTTPDGFNQREADVMFTFRECLDQILYRDPDLVIHSGDLFHVVRPSNGTIVAAYAALDKFQRDRKGKPLVLIGGNHDTPRTADTGNILHLFSGIEGIRVETGPASRVELRSAEVVCIPHHSLRTEPDYRPAPSGKAKHSFLTIHGLAKQALPKDRVDLGQFDVEMTRADTWDYVALGDFHVHAAYGRNVCYAGSTDFTSSNIWEEVGPGRPPKGWVWFDTSVGQLEHVPIDTRDVLDLDPIDVNTQSVEEVIERLIGASDWSSENLPIVRQRIINCLPSVRAGIREADLREIRAKSLHYQIVATAPARAFDEMPSKLRPGATLEEQWEAHVDGLSDFPPGISGLELKASGLEYLQEVAADAALTTPS